MNYNHIHQKLSIQKEDTAPNNHFFVKILVFTFSCKCLALLILGVQFSQINESEFCGVYSLSNLLMPFPKKPKNRQKPE